MEREKIFSSVNNIITEYLRLAPNELHEESHIINDLGADSLALVELGFKLSEAFGIPMITPNDDNMIIKNLVDIIKNQVNEN